MARTTQRSVARGTTTARGTTKVRVRPQLTPEGVRMIEERIADIRDRRLPDLRPLLVEHERDERYVAEFTALLEEAEDWERFLAEAEVIEDTSPGPDRRVKLGTRVRVTLADGSKAWVRPVHPREAFLDDERISATSPLGASLIGARAGEVVEVDAPVGVWQCTVLTVGEGRSRRSAT